VPDCRSWPREEKINNHGCWGKHAHIPDTDYWGICLFHVVWTIFFVGAIILMWYTRNVFLLASVIFFINWIVRMSDNLPERVQILGHAHIICITVRENRIICCQIFCDLLLKSAFERIFNVIQLILVCRSLFVLLSFFFWPLCCLSFFDLWFWLPLWFLQTLITFLQTSLTKLTSHFESYMMHAFSNWWKIWFRACNEFLFHSWKNETMYCNITLEISTKIN
jgi:hypothetical protein